MMRASHQPLAHLVDAAAEQWLNVECAPEQDRLAVRIQITKAFRIGDNPELTFHGLRYLLSIIRDRSDVSNRSPEFRIEVHKIALHE